MFMEKVSFLVFSDFDREEITIERIRKDLNDVKAYLKETVLDMKAKLEKEGYGFDYFLAETLGRIKLFGDEGMEWEINTVESDVDMTKDFYVLTCTEYDEDMGSEVIACSNDYPMLNAKREEQIKGLVKDMKDFRAQFLNLAGDTIRVNFDTFRPTDFQIHKVSV